MKKYITTKENPTFKEGIEFEMKNEFSAKILILGAGVNLHLGEISINKLLNLKYIKEAQEKEFTKDDVMEFGEYMLIDATPDTDKEIFDKWLKERNK